MAGGARAQRVAGRLPAEVTSFVGRRSELAEVKRLLATARLITLTGVGGAGKTRLAVRVASDLRRLFADGVWQVELGTLTDGSLIEYAVAEALAVRGGIERPTATLLADQLADRYLLLVLDNCEHLLDACARLAVSLLRACPGLRVLCTSRQPLAVVGEVVFRVPPLPVRGPAAVSDSGDHPALTLFVERAAAAASGFALAPHNERIVTDICTRLDGLPLAIELAAARLRTLTVEQLAAGLTDRFGVLTTRHAVPPHHRRLRDAFDWSFDLCAPAERLLWRRLAVFGGGFDLDAARAVCAGEHSRSAGPERRGAGVLGALSADGLLDVLGGLVDKSVVIREEVGGEARYRLLETVREYGLCRARAAGDDVAALRRRHRDWYLRLAEEFDAGWFGPHQLRWAQRLRSELPNLRAALSWSLTTPGEAAAGQRIAAALKYFWTGCGAQGEGRLWLDRALAADHAATAARVGALSAYTRVLVMQGEHAAAAAGAEESRALACRLDDPALLATARYDVGTVMFMRAGDLDQARAILADGLAGFVAGGDALGRVLTQINLALIALYGGDPERADRLCAECRDVCQAHGDRWWFSYALQASAIVAFSRGAVDEADGYARQALRTHHAIGDSYGMVTAFDEVAHAAALNRDLRRAACLLGASSRAWRSIGGDATRTRRYWRGREKVLDGIRSEIGEAAFDAAFERGRRMSQDDAVQFALGLSTTTGPVARRPPTDPLTGRERQVVDLITQGLSNQDIAARLVISRRTAESHVENILRKLGFTSRTQVVAWAARNSADGAR